MSLSEIEKRDYFIRGFGSAHTLVSTTHFSCATAVFPDNELSFVAWFMWWLIRRNHKLGKMFSAPSHAVKSVGLWFRACRSVAAVKGGRGSNRARSALTWVNGECEGPGRKWKAFLVFQGLFFYVLGDGGALVFRFQLNMMDQTSWKINTQSQRPTLCHSLYCISSNSLHHVCKNTHTHTKLPPLLTIQ